MDTGVRDLEVAFFKANSTWLNDTCSKIYQTSSNHRLESAGLNALEQLLFRCSQ